MMRFYKFIFLTTLLFLAFYSFHKAQAFTRAQGNTFNNYCPDYQATGGPCVVWVDVGLESNANGFHWLQAHSGYFNAHLTGNGNWGPSGGKGSVDGCLGPSPTMNGECRRIGNYDVGDGDGQFDGGFNIGGDTTQGFKYWTVDLFVNDGRWDQVYVSAQGRLVEAVFTDVPPDVVVNQSFAADWYLDQDDSFSFSSSGPISCVNNGAACTATGQGTATVTICAAGPTGDGNQTLCETRNIIVNQAAPGPFNLSVNGCVGGTNRFDLSWTSSSGATSYQVYAKRWTTGTWATRGGQTTATTATYYENYGDDWYFKVVASNGSGSIESDPYNSGNFVLGGNCPGPSADIKANGSDGPITIAYNAAATISWTSVSTPSCTVSPPGWSGTSNAGISTGALTTTTTYTLNCSGASPDSVTVNVSAPLVPVPDIKANGSDGPITIGYNANADVTWTSVNANSCSVSPGGWTGLTGSPGAHQETLIASRTYTITCDGDGATTGTDSVTVNVNTPTGTIFVNSNNGDAVWNITGASTYNGSGVAATYNNAPAGSYTISADIPDFDLNISPSATQTLTNASSITFTLTYLGRPDISAGGSPACNHAIIEWNDVAANDGYTVWRATASAGPFTQIGSLGANANNYDDTPSPPNINYYYQIRAFKNSPGIIATSNTLSIFVVGCTPNLGNSSKIIYQVNGAAYSGATIVKSGDTLTFRIIITNSGNDSGIISGIIDTMTPNITNARNISIDKGSGFSSIGSFAAVTGIIPQATNWIVQFDTTAELTLSQEALVRNTATINCTGQSNGVDCTVTRSANHFAASGSQPPKFREVAP